MFTESTAKRIRRAAAAWYAMVLLYLVAQTTYMIVSSLIDNGNPNGEAFIVVAFILSLLIPVAVGVSLVRGLWQHRRWATHLHFALVIYALWLITVSRTVWFQGALRAEAWLYVGLFALAYLLPLGLVFVLYYIRNVGAATPQPLSAGQRTGLKLAIGFVAFPALLLMLGYRPRNPIEFTPGSEQIARIETPRFTLAAYNIGQYHCEIRLSDRSLASPAETPLWKSERYARLDSVVLLDADHLRVFPTGDTGPIDLELPRTLLSQVP